MTGEQRATTTDDERRVATDGDGRRRQRRTTDNGRCRPTEDRRRRRRRRRQRWTTDNGRRKLVTMVMCRNISFACVQKLMRSNKQLLTGCSPSQKHAIYFRRSSISGSCLAPLRLDLRLESGDLLLHLVGLLYRTSSLNTTVAFGYDCKYLKCYNGK